MSEQDKKIETFSEPTKIIQPPAEFREKARVKSLEEYQALYKESIESPDSFWKRETGDLVFRKPWTRLLDWQVPFAKWFIGAELNVTESCLDRHMT
ncbi:MAG TPA: acetyl-coenzyme A synthetase N-terminal domain-containing protein, partial [Polyangiaceae bacterium]|nr:acetyl-coenzyme A synthetase N-terminal domain-containing protein [Polyangiaceae bacterium]